MTFALLCTWSVLNAVPVKPEVREHVQSDGTTIRVRPVGDEWHHGFVTADDGLTLSMASNGDFYYKTTSGVSQIMAHNQGSRSSAENTFVAANKDLMTMAAQVSAAAGPRRARAAAPPRKVGATQVPVTGSPRVPIILVEYKDKKMSNTMEAFMEQYTNGANSVLQYFTDQSNGKYTPQFDLYGIYTLNNNRSVYGGNSGSDDVGVARMVGEAIDMAGDDIDWSLYDNDDDGEADVCIVVYAGVGEAQAYGIVPNAVWPCQWELSTGQMYGDGTGQRYRNDVTIDRFAVFNEVGGSNDRGKQMDGIGTFCHEFSHCLGLPDFYATNYASYYGMGNWSLMDGGCYNGYANGVDGTCPVGYSAYEKEFMGWVELRTPAPGATYTLPTWNAKSEETDVAYKIVSDLNPDEYFILSNRRQQGWDTEIADQGMLIEHVTFVQSRWDENTPNNKSVQLMTIMPADNILSEYTENADCWGKNNKYEFSDNSSPSSGLNLRANGSLASTTGGAGKLGKPVTQIKINNNGTVTFTFMEGQGGIQVVDPVLLDADAEQVTSSSFTAAWTDETEAENVSSYTLQVNQDGYVPPLPEAEMLLEESFEVPANTTWTRSASGTFNETTAGYIRLGNNTANGSVTSPGFDATKHQGVVTVKLTARNYARDTDVPMKVSLLDANGKSVASETFTLIATDSVYVAKLSGATTPDCKVRVESTVVKKRVMLKHVQIFGGDPTEAAGARRRAAVEEGDEHDRIITGITDKQYTVENLVGGATYNFKLKALYVDGTESEWTATKQVTLLPSEEPTPVIEAYSDALDFGTVVEGTTDTLYVSVHVADLKGDLGFTLNDETGMFVLPVDTLRLADITTDSMAVAVVFAPTAAGTYTATVTVGSEGAEDVVVSLTGIAEAAPKPLQKGDVNMDGEIGVSDLTALVNIILSGEKPEGDLLFVADVNNDGEVGIADITALINIIMGIENDETAPDDENNTTE